MKEIENMELQATHSNGDWLVHQYYGVGQLKGKEIKNIGGEESFYFRLEMDNKSTIFIPDDKLNSEWFRPVASDNKLEEVKEILARPSKKMAQNFNIRKSRIKKVMTENSITGIARTVRDLSGRRKRRKTLSKTEDSALRKLKDRLLAEWAVATGLEEDEAKEKLKALLEEDEK
jgi:RNA polymerase-interacting CarD/CdnL/TRCF family regulator